MPRKKEKEERIRTCYDDGWYMPKNYWRGEDYYDDDEEFFRHRNRENTSWGDSDKALRRMTKEFNKRNSK